MSWAFRSGVRNLVRGRGRYQAVAIIGTLGIAVGATLAIASVVISARLKPLPYAHPSELRLVWHAYPGLGSLKNGISAPSYQLYKSMCSFFSDLAAFSPARDANVLLSDNSDPISVRALAVTPNLFTVLGVRPLAGRTFVSEEAQSTQLQPVVVAYNFWREHFGNDEVVGRRITLNGREAQIVGVMPQGFQIIEAVEVWTPLLFTSRDLAPTEHGNEYLTAIGRLRPNVTEAELSFGVAQVSAAIRGLYPQYYPARFAWHIYTSTLTDELTGRYRVELILLSAAAVVLSVIALVNVSALLLARSTLRAYDYGVKVALGSSQSRLLVEAVAEMLLIATFANGIGIVVARLCLRLFRLHVLPHIGENVPPWNTVGVDIYSASLVIVVATCTIVGLGLLPLRLVDQKSVMSSVHNPWQTSIGRRHSVVLNGLVAADIAIALILSVLSLQLLTTIRALNAVDPGFSAAGVETFRVILPRNLYATRAAFDSFQERFASQVQQLPGIQAAGFTSSLPFLNSEANALVVVEGRQGESTFPTNYITCSADYFGAMGIPLMVGRKFNAGDTAQSVPVVIIDQSAAKHFFPNADALSKRIAFTFEKDPDGKLHWREVIGVVGHVRDQTLREDSDSQFYVPYLQAPPKAYTYVVKGTSADTKSVYQNVRIAIKRIDPRLPLHHVRALADIVADSFAITKIAAVLVVCFAVAATILTVVGIYGTVSYSVLLRRKEIGIRLAFGASRQRVLYHTLSRYMTLAAMGIGVALPLSLGLGLWIRSVLFNVRPYEWLIITAASAFVAALTIVSSYIPAVAASRSDPALVLRVE